MLNPVRDDIEDADLILGLVRKEKKCLEMLSERYGRSIFGMAYRLGLSPEDSEEIVQEWLIKLWTKADTWDASKGVPAKAWIYRIANNLCIDRQRKLGRTKESGFVEGFDAEGEESADQSYEEASLREVVEQGLDQLPDNQRQALVMSYYEELSHKEIAEVMDTTPKAVEGLIARARKSLKEIFKGQEALLI